jgi:hypothetical protein
MVISGDNTKGRARISPYMIGRESIVKPGVFESVKRWRILQNTLVAQQHKAGEQDATSHNNAGRKLVPVDSSHSDFGEKRR